MSISEVLGFLNILSESDHFGLRVVKLASRPHGGVVCREAGCMPVRTAHDKSLERASRVEGPQVEGAYGR